ncbi:variable surface protein [Plasmodium gonderi]|uniref:Variable surface protein n=1 Tax=Plasmodium gonderi TaxID=77519 RepID=A0A1Y1JNK6_PLAGO|nr:variable surface protein [Plasmodium gonderi]GAW84176.1 variable surface protein [Plasmodium gonderi]
MGNSQVAKAEVSFSPHYSSAVNGQIGASCNAFNNTFQHKSKNYWTNFTPPCQYLVRYLHEIKDKSEYDRKPYCNFFIYELKREVKNKNPNFQRFDKVHEELIKSYKNTGVNGLDVCKEYVSLMDDNVYDMFNLFDELYKDFKEFKNQNKHKDNYFYSCVKKYEEIINKYKEKNNKFNNTIEDELEKFKCDFHTYLQDKNTYTCEEVKSNCSLMIPPKCRTNVEELSGDTASAVTWTSTGFLFFAILIIIFILYNYTACSSYLRPRKRKLKNIRNRKYKKHYELMNLFEESRKNKIKNKHNILYNSVQ